MTLWVPLDQNDLQRNFSSSKRDAMSSTRRLGPQSLLATRLLLPRCHSYPLSILTLHPSPKLSHSILYQPLFRTPRRNVSTKLHKSIDELPQGLQLPLEPFVEKEASKYSPLIDEVLDNQRRFPKCVLLTRVGQFYEVFCQPFYTLILVIL